ncbi:hypothetical protein HanRHA438_Chr14g0633441 [Helianthus annuus]|uniref:Uncharacterized protein n=1 Tax=Helianthus annuus TaxID=4232 RepID=A0A9K3E7B9_HELAN|nr:hypothetical protein HanXRQr2_Chr14g0623411 [Helianthus annuus]KAJ0838729.1 hypothetical protein HanPSC8_Chr14g0598231 [Helianthus annuus]KAJ0852022.1 hypothetical protein HanRHA438_Chr14g0633441 [Helianthus annuus]
MRYMSVLGIHVSFGFGVILVHWKHPCSVLVLLDRISGSLNNFVRHKLARPAPVNIMSGCFNELGHTSR